MHETKIYDVIIIGGSYAGLSAAMSLGRALRNVLIIDSGQPCNWQTPHSHNFITQDGQTPKQISETAKTQVLAYKTISFCQGTAVAVKKKNIFFQIITAAGETYTCRKLLFATGVLDQMPNLPGFDACWGISVLHCPYCHGYEVAGKPLGIIANGDTAFELGKLISNWSPTLTLFTNGSSTLTQEQVNTLKKKNIRVVEKAIGELVHQNGYLKHLLFQDGSTEEITAVFSRVSFRQHCTIPATLGCSLTEQGFLQVDDFQKTTVAGIFAAGDNTTPFRSLAFAVAAGTKAGAIINKELIDEEFNLPKTVLKSCFVYCKLNGATAPAG